MSRKHVFISYRSREADFAVKLAHSLQAHSIPIWMDQLGGIQPGADWVKALTQGIDESIAMVPILSPDYLASKYCLNELQRADSKGISLFPVMLKTVNLPLELQRIQYVDFRDGQDYETALNKLISVLKEQTAVVVEEAAASEPSTSPSIEVPLRAIDGQIEQTVGKLATLQATDKAKQRQAERLQRRLEMATKRYEAANNQLLSDLNAADIPKLELQVDLLDKEITEIEAQLSLLQT